MRLMQGSSKLLLALAMTAGAWEAQAGATANFDDDRSLSFGFGTRYSYTNSERADASGGGRINNPNLDSARLFLGASLSKNLKAVLNTEWDGERVRVLDLNAQLALLPELNIWAGRFVSPSDRANMAGPYYSMGGGYWPCVASRYGCTGGIFAARDDGVAVWGNVAERRLGYSFGAFDGRTYGIGALDESQARSVGIKYSDSLMYSGRLQYDFWDLETEYFSAANYLGARDILAIGLAGRYQKQGVLTIGGKGDYWAWNADFLFEKRIKGSGAVAFEAAYYDYDTDHVVSSEQGKAYSVGLSYIFEKEVGWGRLQPFTHWQRFNPDTNVDTKQYDIGVNYIIDGYNAQVSATYSKAKVSNSAGLDKFVVALQIQY